MNKARGQSGPDLLQGTPIQEVVKRDPEAQEKLPKVMKDELKASQSTGSTGGKRNFSTSVRRRDLQLVGVNGGVDEAALIAAAHRSMTGPDAVDESGITLESEVEPLPALRPEDVFTRRYPAIIEQLVGLMMQHGKKAVAQKVRLSQPPIPRQHS